MAETDTTASSVNPFSAIFWQNNPNVNKELRQKIALAMLNRRSAAPKTFGEGLSAIGDAFADRSIMKQLEGQDLAAQAAGRSELDKYLNPAAAASATPPAAATPTADRVAYAPPADVEQPVPSSSTPAAAKPDLLQTTEQPADMLNPAMTRGFAGPAVSNPPTPAQQAALLDPKSMRWKIAESLNAQRRTPGPAPLATDIRDQGDYNEIDASAGMKRVTPGYAQDAIARNVGDPDRRAYLGSLVAGEAPSGPQEVSPTGAAGPFQFTRGTGKQYDLMPPGRDLRTNLDASTIAADELTNDNAAAFRKINGREPTMADLALMHQQGGVTGARMVAGTGNAPPANLAVNNVNPAAGPAAAVAKIKGYYGLPERPVGPGGPGAPPVMAFDGQATPAQAPISMPQPATPQPQQQQAIMPAPAAPVRVAQAAPAAEPQIYPPGYVIPEPGAMPRRQILQPDAEERKLFIAANTTQNEYSKGPLTALYNEKVKERALRQAELDKVFEHELSLRAEQTKEGWKSRTDQAKRIADVKKTGVETGTARLKEVNGKQMVYGDDGVYRMPTIEGQDPDAPPGGKLNESQGKTVKFLSQQYLMAEQLKGKEKILAQGMKDEALGRLPFNADALMNRHYKMAKRAAEFWVAANLRDISGATIGSKEHTDQMRWLMPQYGDDDSEIKRKAAARQAVMDGMKQSLGDQSNHADYAYKQVQKSIKLEQDKIDEQMKDTPKDGKIYKDPDNPKIRRIWDLNDKKWREL